tara:strand:- start:210 stop:959 length:750 start_codon:yes stop_codon:yes gene_type:complete
MQTKIDYWLWKSIISKTDCQKIINRGLEQLELNDSKGIDNKAITWGDRQKSKDRTISTKDLTLEEIKEKNINTNDVYVRDSNIAWLSDQWIYDLIWDWVKKANIRAGWNYEFDYSEPCQFTIYNKDQFYGWHSDGPNDNHSVKVRKIPGVLDENNEDKHLLIDIPELVGKVRKLSITLMLSDPKDYEGGNLKFDFGVHKETKRFEEISGGQVNQGSMVVFPSYKYHCVTPVTKGTRYSLVAWFNGRPMK